MLSIPWRLLIRLKPTGSRLLKEKVISHSGFEKQLTYPPLVDLDTYYSSLNKNGNSHDSDASSVSPPADPQPFFLGKRERETEAEDERLLKVQKTASSGSDETTNPIIYGKYLSFKPCGQLTFHLSLVAGEAKRFLEITDAEQEMMTPEEYEAYAELMVQLS